jgi:hypothetical protein
VNILGTALTSAVVMLLIQVASYVQVKTTGRALHARPTTRHATDHGTPEGRPRASSPAQEYPGRTPRPTQTAGAPPAPAPYPATHAGPAAGGYWTSSTWPPLDTADDTHVTEAVT